jgi:UTP-glucose-1-phosphate uridylyltransferase
MKKCPLLEECRFFNDIIENVPSVSARLKEQYCLGDNSTCARLLVSAEIGKEHLPDDVFPHEMEKAQKIIRHFRVYGELD